jgi:hypothetical protein
MEYRAFTGYDQEAAREFQREMDSGGFECYGINAGRTSTFVSMQYKREFPRDANGFTDSDVHRADEVKALKHCLTLSETGVWGDFTAYKDVMFFLYDRGWVEEDCRITESGRAALASQEVTT